MFSARQVAELARRGISEADAVAAGVVSVGESDTLPPGCPAYWTAANGYLPGLLFPWVSVAGHVEYQIRPDEPPVDGGGRPIKYASRSRGAGYQPVLWAARQGDPQGAGQTILLTEGTCQTLAASLYAPEGMWVLGMLGCRGWMSDGAPIVDLSLVAGVAVVVALDADLWSNVDVWDAGSLLQRALKAEGAASVKFVRLAASKKTGLDDLLGQREPEARGPYLASIISQAIKEPFPAARRPKPAPRQVGADDPNRFFTQPEGLLVDVLAGAIRDESPALLTAEKEIALYRDGVYQSDGTAFKSATAALLVDRFRPGHRMAAQEYLVGVLARERAYVPEHAPDFLINFRNGMLDPMTGELLPHSPDYMSTLQFPVVWDETATCPNYERWLGETVGSQIDDLEEVSATMLDRSRTPTKALFLYGPSRSGKSTYLRLLVAVAGKRHTSAISLATLADDKFAAAQVYGRVLNCSADLSSAHLEDLSIFKLMTGDDLLTANRKYGQQFEFRNQALFAFSANELPSVGESSRAYAERIKPFSFPNSFAGHEDPAIEDALRIEIPGIVVRWVTALRRLRERAAFTPTDDLVSREFERRSDRVRQFLAEACTIAKVPAGTFEVPAGAFATASDLAEGFERWARAQHGRPMGRNKLIDRLTSVDGVIAVRGPARKRGYNIRIRPEGDWSELPAGTFEGGLRAVSKTEVPAPLPSSEQVAGSSGTFPETTTCEGGADNTVEDPSQNFLKTFYKVSGGKLPELPADQLDDPLFPLNLLLAEIPKDGQPYCLGCGDARTLARPVFWICPRCHPDSHAH